MAIRKSSRTVASGGYHSASEADASEQGWLEFLAAENVTDWVVLHGGAIAVFRVQPTVEAARLTEAVAAGGVPTRPFTPERSLVRSQYRPPVFPQLSAGSRAGNDGLPFTLLTVGANPGAQDHFHVLSAAVTITAAARNCPTVGTPRIRPAEARATRNEPYGCRGSL
jgi:hypothetical protein